MRAGTVESVVNATLGRAFGLLLAATVAALVLAIPATAADAPHVVVVEFDNDVNPVAPEFQGECAGELNGAFASCVSSRIACRFCEGVNVADDISPPADCDLFDDGLSNGSCP